MDKTTHNSHAGLAEAIRELAGLLDQAGRGHAAAVLDDEASSIAAGVTPRGLSALRRMNALRAGLAAAADAADALERGAPERARLRSLADEIGRALRTN
jgi:hypothetical protein